MMIWRWCSSLCKSVWFRSGCSIFLLCMVFWRIDSYRLLGLLQTLRWQWLLLALLFFQMSRWVAAQRLFGFLKAVGLRISSSDHLKLYYLCLWYNTLLPGGVGGDVYKVYWLQRYCGLCSGSVLRATIFDRLSGLWALGILIIWWLMPSGLVAISWWSSLAVLLGHGVFMLALECAYLWCGMIFYSDRLQSMGWALLMQCLQVLTVLVLLKSLGVHTMFSGYVVVFLLSSLATVLPVTIGGLGARECVFMFLQPYAAIDSHVGMAVSSLFYLLGILSALPGVCFIHWSPRVVEEYSM